MDDSDIFKKVLKESQKPLTTINSDTSITNILLREYLQLMQKMHTPHEAFGIATSIFHVAHPCVFMGKHLNSAQKKPNLYGFSIFDFLSDDIGDPFGSTETTIVYSGCHLFSEKTPHLERRKHPSIQKIQSLMHDILSDHDIPYNETQIPDFLTK